MKILKINDNLKINIEQIYSLERTSNQKDINEWNNLYKDYIDLYSKDPITLQISEDKIFTPIFGEENDPEDLKLYAAALNEHIIDIIGVKPNYIEHYYILLITGLKINISKDIYDIIDNYLESYTIKADT